ncbi:hypothetical protein MOB92_04000 [Bacillus haynesii]|nr:hypothetical protein [Bacillus haynesii]
MNLKRILHMTGIFLIAAAVILSGFIISDVAYDPFMEDSQSMLFFTIGTYLTTPFFCFIGGFILLGIGKLIDLQEKHNAIVAERLDIICQNGTAGEHAREENETAQLTARTVETDSFTLPAAEDRKYWNG